MEPVVLSINLQFLVTTMQSMLSQFRNSTHLFPCYKHFISYSNIFVLTCGLYLSLKNVLSNRLMFLFPIHLENTARMHESVLCRKETILYSRMYSIALAIHTNTTAGMRARDGIPEKYVLLGSRFFLRRPRYLQITSPALFEYETNVNWI